MCYMTHDVDSVGEEDRRGGGGADSAWSMAESWEGTIRLGFSLPPGATHTHANVTTAPPPRPKETLVLATEIFVTMRTD